jgi:hypothetical protein
MKWLTNRSEAIPFPSGTLLISKDDGRKWVIEKECGCGNGEWLHYEVRLEGDTGKFCTVWQHSQIEQFFQVSIGSD